MSSAYSNSSQKFVLAPGQSLQSTPLDNFIAQSVLVDNPTGQWWYLPTQSRYIAPNTLGAVVDLSAGSQGQSALNSGVSLAYVLSQTPPGQTSNPSAGQYATFIYTSLALGNGSGQATSINIDNSTIDVNITNSSVNANIESAAVSLAVFEPTVQILNLAQNNVALQNGNSNIQSATLPVFTSTAIYKIEHVYMQVPKTTSSAQAYAELDLLDALGTFIGVLARVDSVTTAKNFLVAPMSLQILQGWQLKLTALNADTVIGAFNTLCFIRRVQ